MLCIHQRNLIRTGSVSFKFIFRSIANAVSEEDDQFCKSLNKKKKGKVSPIMSPGCKVAVITGGTGCVGMATAHQLLSAKAGAVALIDTDICNGKKAVEMLNCAHGKDKAMFVKADVSKKKDIGEAFQKIKSELKKIHIVVNAAGVWDEKNWETHIGAELYGTIHMTLLAIEHLEKGGFVLNLCGTPGITSNPLSSPYPMSATSSAAIIALSRSLGHPKNYTKTGTRILVMCLGITNTCYIKNVEQRTLRPDMSDELKAFVKDSKWQKAESSGRCVVQLIQCAQTGTVWVSEGSQLFRVDLPHWKGCSSLQAQYV